MTCDRLAALRSELTVFDPTRAKESLTIIREGLEELLIIQRRDNEVAILLVEQLARPEIRANLPRLTLLFSAANEVRLGLSGARLSLGCALLAVVMALDPAEAHAVECISYALSAATRLVGVHVLSYIVQLLDDRYPDNVHLVALMNATKVLEATPFFGDARALTEDLRAAARKILTKALVRQGDGPTDRTLVVVAAQVLCLGNSQEMSFLISEMRNKGGAEAVRSFLDGVLLVSLKWQDRARTISGELAQFHVLVTEALAEPAMSK